eukprot:Hpha_TRINITY_DN15594_c2_g3::TRINITY_DN15594_c2_g3_i1::g.107773::m.107773
MVTALSKSAPESTYTWQIPSAWPRTGTSVLAMTYFTNSLDPRGMMRSMYSDSFSICAVCSLVVSSATTSSGTFAFRSPSLIAATMAVHVRTASLPHLSSTPLPDFTASEAIWRAASGRASKMMPSTPSGTVTRRSTSPSESSRLISVAPMGSGRRATSRTPVTVVSSLDPLKTRRACSAGATPADGSLAALMSSSLAASMAPRCFVTASAIARSAALRCSRDSVASSRAALRAAAAVERTSLALSAAHRSCRPPTARKGVATPRAAGRMCDTPRKVRAAAAAHTRLITTRFIAPFARPVFPTIKYRN